MTLKPFVRTVSGIPTWKPRTKPTAFAVRRAARLAQASIARLVRA